MYGLIVVLAPLAPGPANVEHFAANLSEPISVVITEKVIAEASIQSAPRRFDDRAGLAASLTWAG